MQFKIQAKSMEDHQIRAFFYDNETNELKAEDGFVFRDDSKSAEDRPLAPVYSKDAPPGKRRDFRILKIQLGLSCNYSCDYCSQRFVERPPENNKKAVDGFIDSIKRNLDVETERPLRIEFWGGEPLVYIKTLMPLVEALQELFSSWKRKPAFTIITNGSLLTPEINYWLMTNEFHMAISHDGPYQAQRGPDPFDDPAKKKVILDLYKLLRPANRISFNSMLTANGNSRKAIYDWFVELTGDENVVLGEGDLVDAYDDGGLGNQLSTKAAHFAFRKQAFNDVYSNNGKIGFTTTLEKIDSFTKSVLSQTPATTVGQKCGMDDEGVLAVDLKGNVLTCQNVSISQPAHDGMTHHLGNIDDLGSVKLKTATHWRNRPMCASCPVLHLCRGSCLFIQDEYWESSCDNAYSDKVAMFALSFERITGHVPILIEGGNLPPERADIWGDVLTHEEKPKKAKPFPVKVVAQLSTLDGTEVYTKSELVHAV